jgi:hypothetical protein
MFVYENTTVQIFELWRIQVFKWQITARPSFATRPLLRCAGKDQCSLYFLTSSLDMEGSGSSSDGKELPPSVRAMLRISGDSADPQPQTIQAMGPSPLLARMQDFLPLMAAANAALPEKSASGGTCVEILHQGGGESPKRRPIPNLNQEATSPVEQTRESPSGPADGTPAISHDALDKMAAGEGDVLMDLYVDNTCGELVSRQEDAGPIRPRIVEISSGLASKDLD